MIINRYLYKEIIGALLGVTLVLLLVFLSNQLVRYLGYAASGKLAVHFLLQLLGCEVPYLLALLLPLGLYLGIILAYGRLYADSELPVLHACGFSLTRLLKVTSLFALVITAVVIALTFWINPIIAAQKGKIIAEGMSRDNMLDMVMPGRFQVSSNGNRVVYVESVSKHRTQARNIFIAEQGKNTADDTHSNWTVVSAAEGSQVKDKNSPDRFVVAHDGYRYEGVPGQNDFKIIQFKKYYVRVPTILNTKRQAQESLPLKKLWEDYQKPENAAELQWRFAMPISAFLLALIAIPLSHVKPRAGRYSQIVPAVLVYVVYVNLLFLARNWIEQKTVSTALGMWWVHGIMIALAVVLLAVQSNWHVRYFKLLRVKRA